MDYEPSMSLSSEEETSPVITLIPPPTNEIYMTVQALINAVNEHTEKQGYAVIKQQSKRNKKKMKSAVYLQCDRENKHMNCQLL